MRSSPTMETLSFTSPIRPGATIATTRRPPPASTNARCVRGVSCPVWHRGKMPLSEIFTHLDGFRRLKAHVFKVAGGIGPHLSVGRLYTFPFSRSAQSKFVRENGHQGHWHENCVKVTAGIEGRTFVEHDLMSEEWTMRAKFAASGVTAAAAFTMMAFSSGAFAAACSPSVSFSLWINNP